MKESVISSLEVDKDGMDCKREKCRIWKPAITSLSGEMKGEEKGEGD
jgi:hypothetical protein